MQLFLNKQTYNCFILLVNCKNINIYTIVKCSEEFEYVYIIVILKCKWIILNVKALLSD